MSNGRIGVGEGEKATGEVGVGVAAEGEEDRFIAVDDPDFSGDGSLDAVVDFTADTQSANAKVQRPNC